MSWVGWTGFLRRRRWPVAAAMALLTVGAALLARGMPIRHDAFALFASADPEIPILKDFWATFGNDTNFLLVLYEPEGGDPFAPAALDEVRALSRRLATVAGVAHVQSLSEARRLRVDEGALDAPRLLSESAAIDAAASAAVREGVTGSAALQRMLLGDDGRVTALHVSFAEAGTDIDGLRMALAGVDAAVAAVRHGRVEVVGVPVAERGYVERIRGDQGRLMPLTVALLLLILVVLFRSVSGALLPLAAVGVSAAITVATMRLCGESFNMISFTIPTLLLVVGVGDSLHLIERYLEERRRGCDSAAAVDRATAAMGAACLLTSTTTMAGFGSLATARIETIRTFGLWAAYGVGVAYLVTITLVPLWLSLRPVPLRGYESHSQSDRLDRLLNRLGRITLARPWWVVAVWALLAAIWAVGAAGVRSDSSMMEEMFDDDPLKIAQKFAEANGFAVLPVEVDLQGPPGTFRDPANLQRVAELEAWLQARPEIGRTASFADLVGELHLAFRGAPGMFTDAAELGQALFLAEARDDGELARWVTPDYSRMHVRALRYDQGIRVYRGLHADLRQELDRRFADADVRTYITGSSRVATLAVDAIVGDLFGSLSTAFVIIAVMMTLLFRNLKIGLLSMIPNALPLLVAAALMGWSGSNLRISSGIIFSVALGIVVDDTIHFLARYRAERLGGATPELASLRTIRTAGRGMTWTSVLLCGGFALLATSGFRGIVEFGLLVGAILGVGLAADLTLTPALLTIIRPFARRGERS